MEITSYDDVLVESRDATSSTLYSVVKNKPFDIIFALGASIEDLAVDAELVFADGDHDAIPYIKQKPLHVSFFFGNVSSKSKKKTKTTSNSSLSATSVVTATCKIGVLSSQCENSNFRIRFFTEANGDDETFEVFSEKIKSVSKKSQLTSAPKRKRTTQLATREAVLQALASFQEMMSEQRLMMEELRQQNADLKEFNSVLMERLQVMPNVIPSTPEQEHESLDAYPPSSKKARVQEDEEEEEEEEEPLMDIEYGNVEEYPLEFNNSRVNMRFW